MSIRNIGVVLCVATAMIGFSAQAGSHRKEARGQRQVESGMQVVPVAARAGEPGHGWQYFSNVRQRRAVVISPGGDYYYSRGKGLELVFKGAAAA